MKLSLSIAIILIATCHTGVFAFSSADNSGGNVHDQTTREALKGIVSEANLKVITDANSSQDQPGSEGLAEARRHFGDERMISSLGYVDREKKRALNYASEADTDPEQRGRALRHFGEMLHTVQDFYSRTNYLELMVANQQYKEDPYAVPLVDWMKVPDGYPGLQNFCAKTSGASTAEFVKDSLSTGEGKKIISSNVTYFQAAKDLAVRETQRQWNLFETLIRNRCGERAPAIIAALKQASPEVKVSHDKDAE